MCRFKTTEKSFTCGARRQSYQRVVDVARCKAEPLQPPEAEPPRFVETGDGRVDGPRVLPDAEAGVWQNQADVHLSIERLLLALGRTRQTRPRPAHRQ